MSPVLNNALWPYMSPHPDKVADEFFAVLKTVETGWLKFTVLHFEPGADADSIKKMKFQIDLTVPKSFKLADGFHSRSAACHAHPQ
jgi:hypothetical protein